MGRPELTAEDLSVQSKMALAPVGPAISTFCGIPWVLGTFM